MLYHGINHYAPQTIFHSTIVGTLCRIESFCMNENDLLEALSKFIMELQFKDYPFKIFKNAIKVMAHSHSKFQWNYYYSIARWLWMSIENKW